MISCGSVVHQMREYQRTGELDACGIKMNELITCLSLKISNQEKARKKLEAMFPGKGDTIVVEKKVNELFVYRDEPPAQWKRFQESSG